MAALRQVATEAGIRVPDSESQLVRFGGGTFHPGPENRQVSTVNTRDEDRILRSIRSAAKQADFVIVHSHSHDIAGSGELATAPAHLRDFIKKCIDAGADVFALSGAHRLRGIEIYKGKPIFYSLGNFFMQNETIEPMPDDMCESFGLGGSALAADFYDARSKPDPKTGLPTSYYAAQADIWESVVAVRLFQGHRVVEIKFYPVDMGFRMLRAQQGTKDRKDWLPLCRNFPVSPPPAAADNGPYVDFDGCPTTSAPFYIRTASQDTTSWRTPALLQHAFVLSRRYAAIAHFQGHPGGGPSHSSTKGTVWFAPAKGAPTSAG